MKIENLKRAEDLAKELRELKKCSDLLQGGGYVKVYGSSANNWEHVNSYEVKQELRQSILNRMDAIQKEIETL